MLLPLPEPRLLQLDLLREPLTQHLFLFLELGIVNLFDFGLAKFAGLHLREAVRFIVVLFGRVDQVQHVGANEDAAQFLEVAVFLVLDYLISSERYDAPDQTRNEVCELPQDTNLQQYPTSTLFP